MRDVPAPVWLLAFGALAAWYFRGQLRGNRPADENTAYALANRLFSSDGSSIGSDIYDATHTTIDPTASGTYRHADGLVYYNRVNLYSKSGVLVSTVDHDKIPSGYQPKPANGVVYRAIWSGEGDRPGIIAPADYIDFSMVGG